MRDMPFHHSPSACELRALVAAQRPFVLTGLIDTWPARSWTLESIQRDFGDLLTCVRLHPRNSGNLTHAATSSWSSPSRVPFEGECSYCEVSLGEYCMWLASSAHLPESSPLRQYPRAQFVGYCDYQDMPALFASAPAALAAVDWSHIVAAIERPRGPAPTPAHDGSRSTLWLGSEQASTPTHYDSYGLNFVAQLLGRKLWRLRRPGPSSTMRPTRVPYEESSVFLEVDATARGDHEEKVESMEEEEEEGEWHVELEAGEVLYVPRHWWHAVITTSDHALSINTWLDAPEDGAERIREAIVRLIAGALIRVARRAAAVVRGVASVAKGCEDAEEEAEGIMRARTSFDGWEVEPGCGWVNPTEEISATVEADLELLNAAIANVIAGAKDKMKGEGGGEEEEERALKEDEATMASASSTSSAALASVDANRGGRESGTELDVNAPRAVAALSARSVARAICIGEPIEVAARALHRRLCTVSYPDDEEGGGEEGGGEEDGGREVGGGSSGGNLRAPLGRLLRAALLAPAASDGASFAEAFARLAAHAPGARRQIRLDHVINATCTGRALDQFVRAIGAAYRDERHGATGPGRKRGRGAAAAGAQQGGNDDDCVHAPGACDCDPSCTVS